MKLINNINNNGQVTYAFYVKECKNKHVFLGQPNKKEKCPTCNKKLK